MLYHPSGFGLRPHPGQRPGWSEPQLEARGVSEEFPLGAGAGHDDEHARLVEKGGFSPSAPGTGRRNELSC